MGNTGNAVFSQYYADHLSGGRRKNNPTLNAQTRTEQMYMRILTELAVNRFKWVGLPDSVDERFLETTLFFQGLSVFYFDPDFERFLALRSSGTGPINHYDNPTKFTVTGNLMFHSKTLEAGAHVIEDPETKEIIQMSAECVPIWANTMRCPDLDIVQIYAGKLARADQTIEIAIRNSRFTKLVTADENSQLSMTNIMRMVEEGLPVIQVNTAFDPAAIQSLDVGPTMGVVSELQIARTRLWNECMGLLGIQNANQDKKERLVADEVAANDEQTMGTRNIAMASRRYAASLINKLYGSKGLPMSVSVQWNADLEPAYKAMIETGNF
jgi:hypothetical protein